MGANGMRAMRRWARSRGGLWGLFVASFLETTVVPIPFEAILVPMLVTNRSRLWLIATVAFAGCIVGGIAGYAAGYFAYETVGRPILQALDLTDQFTSFRADFEERGFWVVVTVGISPVPFQVATVGSGVAGYPLGLFVVAIAIARGVRYYGLAALAAIFGDSIQEILERHTRTAQILLFIAAAAAVAYLIATYAA